MLKYGFIAPALIILIALNIFPLFYNIILGFTNSELSTGGTECAGLRNYSIIFTEPKFAAALRTTALFVFAAVTAELALGFGLALALKDRFRGKMPLLTLLLIPMMLSQAVMGRYWYLILNGESGILNNLLGMAGLHQPQWLNDPGLKLVSVLIIDVWMWTPFMMLIALAGLNSIPQYIYEAAEIDRAGTWTVFRRITLPMCAPLLVLAVLLRTTDALKQFDLVLATTGPNDAATQTLSALLYQTVFKDSRVGLGCAYACIILVIVIALASVFTRYIDFIQSKQGKTNAAR
ncbi:MAG TPA: sugar ABC transporter permease [Planctomycetota bacterium]|nr:sugar ABC transporter permease [Planctomycetota bacterium]